MDNEFTHLIDKPKNNNKIRTVKYNKVDDNDITMKHKVLEFIASCKYQPSRLMCHDTTNLPRARTVCFTSVLFLTPPQPGQVPGTAPKQVLNVTNN